MLSCLVLFCVLWILLTCIRPIQLITLAPIFWNASNPIFKASKNDHVIDVKPFDDVDIVCPYYHFDNYYSNDKMFRRTNDEPEYYHIYLVSRREYDNCNIYDDNGTVLLLSCSNPHQRKRFTVLFDSVQSIPNVPEFRPDNKYYFITTSTRRKEGVDNLYQGACVQHNMKLTVRISQEPKSIDSNRRPANKSINIVKRMPSNSSISSSSISSSSIIIISSSSSPHPPLVHRRHKDRDDDAGAEEGGGRGGGRGGVEGHQREEHPLSMASDRRREGAVTTIGTAAITPLHRTSLTNRAAATDIAMETVVCLSFIAVLQPFLAHLDLI